MGIPCGSHGFSQARKTENLSPEFVLRTPQIPKRQALGLNFLSITFHNAFHNSTITTGGCQNGTNRTARISLWRHSTATLLKHVRSAACPAVTYLTKMASADAADDPGKGGPLTGGHKCVRGQMSPPSHGPKTM